MLYMLLTAILMFFCLINVLRTTASSNFTLLSLASFMAIPATATLVLPWAITIAGATHNYPASRWESLAVIATNSGMVSSLALAGIYLYRGIKEKGRPGFISAGLVLCSLIVAFIFFDNTAFNKDETGLMNTSLATSMDANIECSFGGIAFKYVRGGESEWRCPKSMMLMQGSDKVFIPWPDYTEGRSLKLTRGIDMLTQKIKDADKQDRTLDIDTEKNKS